MLRSSPGRKVPGREAGGIEQWRALRFMVCTVVLFVSFWGVVGAQAPATPSGEDPFRAIVDFVIERDPVLEAQRAAVAAARQWGALQSAQDPGIPAFAQSQLLQAELARATEVAQAQERYTTMERGLVQEVLGQVQQLLALVNRRDGLKRNQALLGERLATAERQVQAGLMNPEDLWTLSDRTAEIETAIADTEDELATKLRETAFSYGGDDWNELLSLLQELVLP